MPAASIARLWSTLRAAGALALFVAGTGAFADAPASSVVGGPLNPVGGADATEDAIVPPRHDHASVGVTIDGRLDEDIWRRIPAYDHMLVTTPDVRRPARFRTQTFLFYTERGLYVGAWNEQPSDTLMGPLSGPPYCQQCRASTAAKRSIRRRAYAAARTPQLPLYALVGREVGLSELRGGLWWAGVGATLRRDRGVELGEMALPAWAVDWPVAHLATAGRDGPHVVAVVFCEVGGAIWVPIDGKPKSGAKLKRVRNIEANGRASLLVDEYDEDWAKLRWVRVDGEADVVKMPADVAAAFRAKYPQYRSTPLGDTRIRITARRSREWSATSM